MVQLAYRYIYADVLRVVWFVITGIAGAGLIVSALVRDESMDRGNNAKKGFRDEKKEKDVEAVPSLVGFGDMLLKSIICRLMINWTSRDVFPQSTIVRLMMGVVGVEA